MAIGSEFRDYVLEMLEAFGPVTAKAMFGGAGLYLDGAMFALITRNDVLYFRTDEANRGDFEAAGMGPFVPFADRPYPMPYHEVPAEVMEDPDDMCAWAGKAWVAARRARDKGIRKTGS